MLRLIDIVLNVLFGILMITSIDNQMPVKLVQTSHLAELQKDASGYIMIGLTSNDSFLFDFGKQAFTLKDRSAMLARIKQDKERIEANNKATGKVGRRKAQPQVRIAADSLAKCGDVALMMDICRSLDIPCGLLTVKDDGKD